MKLTCLSEGGGFHFPPCHLLTLCGYRVLFDCPLNLSALTIFHPISTEVYRKLDKDASPSLDNSDLIGGDQKRRKFEKTLDADSLIRAEPYYRSIEKMHLWNVSLIDIVLISSPMGMLGLPFLTRAQNFSAKIYATEASVRIGQLMMEDLISMHAEYRQFYGPEEIGFPQWMKWEELEALPKSLRDVVLGEDGSKLGGLMPLYSAGDVKQCMEKFHTVRYGEEACHNGLLTIKALSSGLEVGSCNWSLKCPKGDISYVSSSVLGSAIAMDFDFNALQGSDIVIYSDYSSRGGTGYAEDDNIVSSLAINNFQTISDIGDNWKMSSESLIDADERSDEMEKLDFICSCSIDSVKAGGSVLIPIGRLGIILQLLERMSASLECSSVNMVPIFILSSVAEELLTFTNIIPEWLCKDRQEKLFSGKSVLVHAELIEKKRLHLFPAIHSVELLAMWKEPCIVFCPHWSLRLGSAVHLLRRWCGDQKSLLVIEEGVDTALALLPFMPMEMKVLQCSFISGMNIEICSGQLLKVWYLLSNKLVSRCEEVPRLEKIQPLLKIIQPKLVLLPNFLRQQMSSLSNQMSSIHYNEGETLKIPKLKDSSELRMDTDLHLQLSRMKLEDEEMHIARLKGQFLVEKGMHWLLPGNEQLVSSQAKSVQFWGKLDLEILSTALQNMGINGFIEQSMNDDGSENVSLLHISEPNNALIQVKATSTVITTADENLASVISEAISSILNHI